MATNDSGGHVSADGQWFKMASDEFGQSVKNTHLPLRCASIPRCCFNHPVRWRASVFQAGTLRLHQDAAGSRDDDARR